MNSYGFRPSNKYILLSREFYKEIKDGLDRIIAAIDTNDARQHALAIQQKLRDKFEPPAHNINNQLTAHTKQLTELDDPRTPLGRPGVVRLDETGRELPE